MDLSIVLPAYNEDAIIGETVVAVDNYLKGLGREYEILVGDDGSTDRTSAVVELLGLPAVRVIRRPHLGKGAILTACLQQARGTYVGFLDADLEIPVEYVGDCLRALDHGYQIAIASKNAVPLNNRHRTVLRRLATGSYNQLVRLLFRSPVRDHQAGLKFFRGPIIHSILPQVQCTGWLWDTEVLVSAVRAGCNIQEVPVQIEPRIGSKVRIVGTSARMFGDLMRLYLRLRSQPPPELGLASVPEHPGALR